MFAMILLQVDPSPFAASFGVPIGALIFVIVVLCGIITGVVWRGESNRLASTKMVVDFVSKHQVDSHTSMVALSESITKSHNEMARSLMSFQQEISRALNRQSRGFDYFMTTGQILERIAEAKRNSPVELTQAEIAAIASQVYTQFRDLDATRS